VCDPVLGDGGRLYVPPSFVAIYRDNLLPLADVALPNQTEAEFLTGVTIVTRDDAISACDVLHARSVQHVVITSIDTGDDHILVVASSKLNSSKAKRMSIRFPKLPGYYSGTGDLTSALILAWLQKTQSLETALLRTIFTVQAVLRRTQASGKKELSLIHSKSDIEQPKELNHIEKDCF
jgi:pyridoxine kinase